MRFNETQVEDVVKWAKDWTRLFVQYARAHKASPTDAIKVHPKTWEEIQEVVRNLNIGIETQKEQLKLMQCSECLGIEKDEGEPPCPKCQGTGFVDVT
jgi:DnaJ-class molecular chaperone